MATNQLIGIGTAFSSVNIDGVGSVKTVAEEAPTQVVQAYQTYLAQIITVFNKDPTLVTDADAQTLQTSLQNLKNLAKNGLQIPSIPNTPTSPIGIGYVSTNMAQSIDLLSRSFDAVGLNTAGAATTQVKMWQDLKGFGLTEVLQTAVSSIDKNRSLQALIELEYVATGNEVIFNSLSGLQTALQQTQKAMNVLNDVQNIHNQISAPNVGTLDPVFTQGGTGDPNFPNLVTNLFGGFNATNANLFEQAYNAVATNGGSAYLYYQKLLAEAEAGTGAYAGLSQADQAAAVNALVAAVTNSKADDIKLNPTFDPLQPFPGFQNPLVPVTNATPVLVTDLSNDRASLVTIIAKLQTINFIDPNNPPNNPLFAQSLQGQLQQVVNDIDQNTDFTQTDPTKAIGKWILDGQDQFGNQATTVANNIQRHITSAITASQSLNDTQNQNVQRYMFIFEEFYKSSTTILQTITQLITKMAQGISRT